MSEVEVAAKELLIAPSRLLKMGEVEARRLCVDLVGTGFSSALEQLLEKQELPESMSKLISNVLFEHA